jgi:hypothetical protein
MKRLVSIAALAVLVLCLWAPGAGAAGFGLKHFDFKITDEEGATSMQAGSHPFAVDSEFEVNTEFNSKVGLDLPIGQVRNVSGELPVGLAGSPFATPRCSALDFATLLSETPPVPKCSNSSVVGLAAGTAALGEQPISLGAPVYNLIPPPGVAAKVGFIPTSTTAVTIEFGVKEDPPYNITFSVHNLTQLLPILGSEIAIWGNPSDPSHDEDRGLCGAFYEEGGERFELPEEKFCPTSNPNLPFITLPRACTGPLATSFKIVSWLGDSFESTLLTHDDSEPPVPLGMEGCSKLAFAPQISAQPTSDRAESPTGLDFHLDNLDEGIANPFGTAHSDLKKAVVTLPEGMTINPSQAEGLAVCTEEDLAREKAGSEFGAGCPAASKIGTVEVETPLLEGKVLKGSLFVAEPYHNRFGSLIALYMTFKEPELGISIKLAGTVEPDPKTGQIRTVFDELPQLPFSHFRLHFREGGRSPLITPPLCGPHTTEALLTPWANPASALPVSSSFTIDGGVDGGPCHSGAQPFQPGFEAGSINNSAGAYSPFYMRLTRRDGDQDLTRFDATLPLGEVAKLAGVAKCTDAQIALAKTKSGTEERANPSCPANSRIGRAVGGAGVGSQLTYVPGNVYLAGPFAGAPLSVVAIVPAVAGPFDVGTIVTRQALQVDPRTAEVRADGAHSDPIPHILAGIPLRVRDIRVYIDRPEFTLNPTSCDPSETAASIWGGGANPFSTLDDAPVPRSSRFQAAGCAGLGLKPGLSLRLKGGTHRGAHPALRAVLRPRPGDANLASTVVRLPRSAFLDQAHIRTICTRVQFAQKACPPGSVYGHVEASTPLLDEPLSGPIYLRSSNHNLPDLVFVFHGLVDFEAVGRIDSVKGGIRASFEGIPDAPISKVTVEMQGAKKGLVVNSRDLCARASRAGVEFGGHNGKAYDVGPVLRADCGGKGQGHRKHRRSG